MRDKPPSDDPVTKVSGTPRVIIQPLEVQPKPFGVLNPLGEEDHQRAEDLQANQP
jgi:hypothetical protein